MDICVYIMLLIRQIDLKIYIIEIEQDILIHFQF